MAYTATKYLGVSVFPFPRGASRTQKRQVLNGQFLDCNTPTFYSVGGIGSTSFQVTAFSAVGLVTYNSLVGMPLANGQRVVVYNTGSNTNDGTYIVSQLTPSSATAGTFVAVPLPNKTLSGSAQTSQTAEGVGQIQWGRGLSATQQTFTVSAVTFSGGIMTCTYTTLVGSQLSPGQPVTLAGMTNAGNNGNFSLASVSPTSATGGSFTIANPSGVATDSGTGSAYPTFGTDNASVTNEVPVRVFAWSTQSGYTYEFDEVNYTLRIFVTGSANGPMAEAAVGATVALDNHLFFEAEFPSTIAA